MTVLFEGAYTTIQHCVFSCFFHVFQKTIHVMAYSTLPGSCNRVRRKREAWRVSLLTLSAARLPVSLQRSKFIQLQTHPALLTLQFRRWRECRGVGSVSPSGSDYLHTIQAFYQPHRQQACRYHGGSAFLNPPVTALLWPTNARFRATASFCDTPPTVMRCHCVIYKLKHMQFVSGQNVLL